MKRFIEHAMDVIVNERVSRRSNRELVNDVINDATRLIEWVNGDNPNDKYIILACATELQTSFMALMKAYGVSIEDMDEHMHCQINDEWNENLKEIDEEEQES